MVKLNYLASPPLVVAYALAGSLKVDLLNDPLGTGSDGEPVYLKDIWPSSNKEIEAVIGDVLTPEMFKARYANVFEGPEEWREIDSGSGMTYMWSDGSTYVQYPPFFEEMKAGAGADGRRQGARALAMSATRSPPTTSRRPAPSRRRARRAST